MRFEVQLAGVSRREKRVVEIERSANGWRATVDGHPLETDAVEISPHTFSVLLHGESHEICVTPQSDGTLKLQAGLYEFIAEVIDPRAWSGRRHGALEAEGRQQISAPMPGKVVRVLVKAGDKVEVGQGLFVVEAMKMQNEIRSPKTGTIERLHAKEGQPVNAGDVLCIVG
jgi:acetyl/propionyl-CoA carboxylase alpha subunit